MANRRRRSPHAAIIVEALQDVGDLVPGPGGERGQVESVNHLRTGVNRDGASRRPELLDVRFAEKRRSTSIR